MNTADLTQDEIDHVISRLALPDQKIQVVVDYSNHKTSNAQVQAYAKLAGSTWTYYVQTLSVVIGRTSEPASEDKDVQIDLGPAKVVSRKHATIQYNGEFWELTVTGRNGVKIDKISHKEGSTRLFSGNILEIGGVQMMFVLPDIKPRIAQGFHKKQSSASLDANDKTATKLSTPESTYRILSHSPYDHSRVDSAASVRPTHQIHMGVSQHPPQHQPYPQHSVQHDPANSYSYTSRYSQETGPPSSARQAYPKGVAMISQSQIRGTPAVGQYLDQDLSTEESKDIKPPFSYATMISQAILSTAEHMMSLADIYEWISTKYSFYRYSKSGWQNSIRHNLSLNKAFEKVPRKVNEPGKGMKWQIVQQFKEEFQKKASQGEHIKGKSTIAQMQRQGQLRTPTVALSASAKPELTAVTTTELIDMEAATVVANLATSPQRMEMKMPISPARAKREELPSIIRDSKIEPFVTPRKQSVWENSGAGSYSDQYGFNTGVSDTPNLTLTTPSPTHRYSLGQISQLEAYTPERGSSNGRPPSWRGGAPASITKADMTPLSKVITTEKLTGGLSNNSSTSTLSLISSKTTTNNNTPNSRTATKSQETTAGGSGAGKIVGSFSQVSQTPAPTQSNLQLMAPTSAQQQQLPSSFMPGSSPAPFWKYMQLSTPVRANDFSPTKFSSPTVSSSLTPGSFARASNTRSSTSAAGGSGAKLGEGTFANRQEESSLGDLQNVDLTR